MGEPHSERLHADLSASGAHGWAICAHWENDDTDSPYAAEGTAAHELAEACLATGKDAAEAIGQVYNGFTVDADMARHVQTFVDYVREHTPADARWLEQRLDYSHVVGEEAWGTGDVVGYDAARCLHIIDLKFGQSPLGIQHAMVPADEGQPCLPTTADDGRTINLQLGLYALGALAEFDFVLDVDTVMLHIVQPRLDHVSTVIAPRSWLEGPFARYMGERAAIRRAGTGDFAPGEKTCQWCARKADCKALATFAFETAVEGFDGLDDPDAVVRDVSRLSNEEIGEILPKLRLIRDFEAAVQIRAVDELMHGNPVPGWKLVEGRGSRDWTDEDAASRALRRIDGIGAVDIYTKTLVSPAQAEKLPGVGKDHRVMKKYVAWKPGKPSLAEESNPKPALTFDPTAGFEEVPDAPET